MRRAKVERQWESQGLLFAGMDEVGVSSIAGPLLACCIILPPGKPVAGVKDSKLIETHEERVPIAMKLMESAVDFRFGESKPHEVSELGTVKASVLAMNRAISNLKVIPQRVISDFHHYSLELPEGVREKKVIKGDLKIYCVAAASIVAKVARDHYMKELAKLDGNRYGWATNVGYRSRAHWDAIRKYGITPHHRERYATVWSEDEIAEFKRMKMRDRKKKPRRGMIWSKRHGQWVWPDTRSAERKAQDERIARAAER
jgi:ribonuclease HII